MHRAGWLGCVDVNVLHAPSGAGLVQHLYRNQGSYVLALLPQVEWVVQKTTIKDSTGKVVDVIG